MRSINAVTDNAPYAVGGIIIFLKLACSTYQRTSKSCNVVRNVVSYMSNLAPSEQYKCYTSTTLQWTDVMLQSRMHDNVYDPDGRQDIRIFLQFQANYAHLLVNICRISVLRVVMPGNLEL